MLFNCVLLGDLTPFNGEFTQQDAIFLNYATQEKLKFDSERLMPLRDIRYILQIQSPMTAEAAKFMPSHVAALERKLEESME